MSNKYGKKLLLYMLAGGSERESTCLLFDWSNVSLRLCWKMCFGGCSAFPLNLCFLSQLPEHCLWCLHIHSSVADSKICLMISLSVPQALLHATCGALKCFSAPRCLREGLFPKHSSSRQLLPSFHMDFDKFLPVA